MTEIFWLHDLGYICRKKWSAFELVHTPRYSTLRSSSKLDQKWCKKESAFSTIENEVFRKKNKFSVKFWLFQKFLGKCGSAIDYNAIWWIVVCCLYFFAFSSDFDHTGSLENSISNRMVASFFSNFNSQKSRHFQKLSVDVHDVRSIWWEI